MKKSFQRIIEGYQTFRKKYAEGDRSVMQLLSHQGQKPEVMVVACCDSRVDPALLLQCDPGDLFVVRNVANLIPPYENDEKHHGTSAALEFGINVLKVKHLVILGHSQCGGIEALVRGTTRESGFIGRWVTLIHKETDEVEGCARAALIQSYQNALTFPWIREGVEAGTLAIHLWFFDIKSGTLSTYQYSSQRFEPLE